MEREILGMEGFPETQFSCRYFDSRWNFIAAAGDRPNLQPHVRYALSARLRGSVIQLFADGIEVIRTILPWGVPPSQVGLWFGSRHKITARNYSITTEAPIAFVAMQFSAPYNELSEEAIKPICAECKIILRRSDETFAPGLIVADIISQINQARLVIADITPENPNVFYEVGYAHASQKPTILIAQANRVLPFDVSGFRTLFYENTIAGKRKVEEGLRKHLRVILGQAGGPET